MYDLLVLERSVSFNTCPRRFIDVDQRTGTDLPLQQFHQRFDAFGHPNRPVAHGCPAQLDAHARQYFLLAVKGQRIFKLGYQKMCQQPGRGDAFGNQLHRSRSDFNRGAVAVNALTAFAGIFKADMADHPDFGRNDVRLFTDFFADAAQPAAAGAGFFILGQVMDDLHARQVFGKRLAAGFLAAVLGNDDFLRLFSRFDLIGSIKKRQLVVIYYRQLFRLAAE
jgi:hypothetical protein